MKYQRQELQGGKLYGARTGPPAVYLLLPLNGCLSTRERTVAVATGIYTFAPTTQVPLARPTPKIGGERVR